jgi:DinB superfamily
MPVTYGQEASMTDPRYPIGKFNYQGPPTEEQRKNLIEEIEKTPAALRSAVAGLSSQQVHAPYREGGWTVQQVVHHLPDSHMNAYVRFKLALTEDVPTIKPYAENLWAQLEDSRSTPLETSLLLLESLHSRWVLLLQSMKPEEWKRAFRHPELGIVPLEKNLALYSWHGQHHVAHITELRKRMGW